MGEINGDDTLLIQALRTPPASSGSVQELCIVVHYLLFKHTEQQTIRFFWGILTLNAICPYSGPNFLTVDFSEMSRKTAEVLERCQKTHRHFILIFFCGSHFFGEHWLYLHITIERVSTDACIPARFSNSRIVLYRIG